MYFNSFMSILVMLNALYLLVAVGMYCTVLHLTFLAVLLVLIFPLSLSFSPSSLILVVLSIAFPPCFCPYHFSPILFPFSYLPLVLPSFPLLYFLEYPCTSRLNMNRNLNMYFVLGLYSFVNCNSLDSDLHTLVYTFLDLL